MINEDSANTIFKMCYNIYYFYVLSDQFAQIYDGHLQMTIEYI